MPEERRWRVTRVITPLASWNLENKISTAQLLFDSAFTLSLAESMNVVEYAHMETKVRFLDSHNSEIVQGEITVTSRAAISTELNIDVLKPGNPDFQEFIDDLSSVLLGNNRTEIQRVASAAGLTTPVTVPILKLEGNKLTYYQESR